MTDRELMQQALDALEDSCYPRMSAKHSVRYDEIVTALRERLAQPVQEPVKFKCVVIDDDNPNGVPLNQWGKQPVRKHVIDCPRCGHCCPQS